MIHPGAKCIDVFIIYASFCLPLLEVFNGPSTSAPEPGPTAGVPHSCACVQVPTHLRPPHPTPNTERGGGVSLRRLELPCFPQQRKALPLLECEPPPSAPPLPLQEARRAGGPGRPLRQERERQGRGWAVKTPAARPKGRRLALQSEVARERLVTPTRPDKPDR